MLDFENLQKRYHDFLLDISNLSISKGEIVGIVGNNGAGKTTFLKLMLDLIKADEGQVVNFGVRVARSEDWKRHTGAYLNEDFLIPYLTPLEYLKLIQNLKHISASDFRHFLSEIEFFTGAALNSSKYIDELSKGNKLKVGITGALVGDPRLLVLDEPFSHLDPSSQVALTSWLKNNRAHNSITLLSSHNLSNVNNLCSRIVLLDNGKVEKDLYKDEGTFDQIRAYFES
ncbi:ABC transporter ATP-binding protein [Aliifodinibius sp. S!AR15-10]|uniref:ABC transporter ATP-binding protein n=1 Tax=Aliifodinibius sp. S!AR15-10 TaxID=2950437 RepID=UPI002856DE39|nr:ABC transporter ATP-binding protein [Aliifodinibius sp. S!AR15-10]MDR8393094.1 ABC transporter ATP-binding protein [Aliifodinibius sp. S!AR15-10]